MSVLFTGDLEALVTIQGHQLQQWGQTLHPTQQHHHMGCRTQDAGQEEAPLLAQTLQHSFGEDQELAGILDQPEEVFLPTRHCGDVVAADPGL